MNNLRKSLFFVFALLAFGQMAWAQDRFGDIPAEVKAEDANITKLGHATITVEMQIVTDSITRRIDTLYSTKDIEWETEPGTAKRRMNERGGNPNGSGFYDEGHNGWLDIYWYTFEYPSINANGERVLLSAMDSMHDEDCYYVNNVIIGCHVTITSNKECPSSYNHGGSATTDVSILMNHAGSGLVFHSTQGDQPYYNLVILPDYEGYGITRSHAHPYLYQELTARQVVDAVRYGIALYKNAWQTASIRHPFRDNWRSIPVGYSQGGSVALATQRFIEQNGLTDELHLAGSVCGDGPYDPIATLLFYVGQYKDNKKLAMPVVMPLILKGMCDSNPYMKNHQVADYLSYYFLSSGILDWLTQKDKTTDDITDIWDDYFDPWPLKLNDLLKDYPMSYFNSLYEANPNYTSSAGVPLPTQPGLMEDLQRALASNDLTKGWVPQHTILMYHSHNDNVVPEVNRASAYHSLGDWVIKVHASGALQYDHVGTGRQFFLGTEEFISIRALAKSPIHQTIENARYIKDHYSGGLDDSNSPAANPTNNVVLGTVNLNGQPITAEYSIHGSNAYLGSGYNACISQYSTGKVEVPSSITVNSHTYPVTEVSDLAFRLCNHLSEVVLPTGVTRIGNYAFVGCQALLRVDLPSTLESIGRGAFIDLANLARVDVRATTPPVWEYNDVFCYHSGGIGDNQDYHTNETMLCVPESVLSVYPDANFTNANIGWTKTDGWGYFNHVQISADENAEAYTVYHEGTLTFYFDGNKSIREGTKYQLNTGDRFPGWTDNSPVGTPNHSPDANDHSADITRVVFAPSFFNARPTSMAKWFCECRNLDTIIGWEYLNTSQVTSMSYLFSNCSKLDDYDLDFSNLVTSNVDGMMNMFENCSGLTQIDLSRFDTRRCKNLVSMFYGCSGLTSLDLSSFQTDSCDYFNDMFYGCSSLEELNIASLNMHLFTFDNSYLFTNCSKLKTLLIPVTLRFGGNAFTGCTNVQDVYCYRYEPFNNWYHASEAFAPNKATRFHVLASAYEEWVAKYGEGGTSGYVANVTFVGDLGTNDSPILLYSAGDWSNLSGLADKELSVNAKMMNDFTITEMLGSKDHPFKGVFDGNGHTLTVNLALKVPDDYDTIIAGPFRHIRSATIKNLHVDGKMTNYDRKRWYFPGGLVGKCHTGSSLITNCRVSTEIIGRFIYMGGIIGYAYTGGTLTVAGCVFDGKLEPSNDIYLDGFAYAGIISYGAYAHTTVEDCVMKGVAALDNNNTVFCDNFYNNLILHQLYGGTPNVIQLGNNYNFVPELSLSPAKFPYSITSGTETLNLDFGTPTKVYDVSGISTYSIGITMDGAFWGIPDQIIPITLVAPGYSYNIHNITPSAAITIVDDSHIKVKIPYGNTIIKLPNMNLTTIILHDDAEDNSHILTDYVDQTYDVQLLGHTIYKNRWNTLCLPFDIPSYELSQTPLNGVKLKVLDTITYSNKVLVYHFKSTNSIEADKPYLVMIEGGQNIENPTFNNVTIQRSLPPGMKIEIEENSSQGFAFMGNYNYMQGDGDDNVTRLYINNHNQLKTFNHSSEFGAFQAYFELVDVTLSNLNAIILDIEDEDDIFYTRGVPCEAVFYKDGNWNDEGNWTNYDTWSFPYSSVYVVADATIPSGCKAEVNSLTVAEEASLTIKDGGQLLHNNESVVATVEKNITGYGAELGGGWNFIASPVVAAVEPTAQNGLATEGYDLYFYDEATHYWRNHKQDLYEQNTNPGFSLNNGHGYLYANEANTTLSFTGALQAGDEGSYTVENLSYACDNENLKGWNLVGNPFPCNATIDKPCYTISGNTINSEVHEANSFVIPPCTGVMVKTTASDQSVTFTKVIPDTQATQTNNNGRLQIALSQVVEPASYERSLSLSKGGVSTGSTTLTIDNAIVSFNEGSQLEKFVFNADNAKLYIPQGGKDYAIAFSEKQGEMPLSFNATKDGSYTITINPEGVEMNYLHLIDNMTGADVDLLALRPHSTNSGTEAQEPVSYTFNAKTTDYESRFRLVFSVCEDGPSTGSGTFAYFNNGNIIITADAGNATLQVIDMTGRIIVSRDGVHTVSTGGMTSGVYVLRLIQGDKVQTQKIVIQ